METESNFNIGNTQMKLKLEFGPAAKFRIALAKPLLFVAQWLIGTPIKVAAYADKKVVVAAPQTEIVKPFPGLHVINPNGRRIR